MAKPIDLINNKFTRKTLEENVYIIDNDAELLCDIHNIEAMFIILDDLCTMKRSMPCISLPKNTNKNIIKLSAQIKKSTKELNIAVKKKIRLKKR